MSMVTIPILGELLEHPDRVSALPLEAIPSLRGELARLDTLLLMRVAMAQNNGQAEYPACGDRLLDVEEAARKLGKSKDYLYRHAGGYPFTVRDGRSVRFSEQGIEKFIRQRMGR